MTKRLIFNGFSMNVVSHIYHGLWRHPESRQIEFNDLDYWTDLVRIFKRGKFDNVFLANVLGVDPIYRGEWDTFVKESVQIPVNDSSTLVAALIHATSRIGLTFTSSILQDHPFSFARRVSTLDHLSRGRIGWNIVPSVSDNAAQNFGFDRIVPHDERYAWAEEYVEVVYKLWEGSWDDDAVLADRASNVYADPSKVTASTTRASAIRCCARISRSPRASARPCSSRPARPRPAAPSPRAMRKAPSSSASTRNGRGGW